VEFLRSCRTYKPGGRSLSNFALANAASVMRTEAANTAPAIQIPLQVQNYIWAVKKINDQRTQDGQPLMTDAEIIDTLRVKPGPPGEPNQSILLVRSGKQ